MLGIGPHCSFFSFTVNLGPHIIVWLLVSNHTKTGDHDTGTRPNSSRIHNKMPRKGEDHHTKIDTASWRVAKASGSNTLEETTDAKLSEDNLTGMEDITIARCTAGLHSHYLNLHLCLQLPIGDKIKLLIKQITKDNKTINEKISLNNWPYCCRKVRLPATQQWARWRNYTGKSQVNLHVHWNSNESKDIRLQCESTLILRIQVQNITKIYQQMLVTLGLWTHSGKTESVINNCREN